MSNVDAKPAFDQKRFYAAIEARRAAEGGSFRQVALKLGISPSTFSRLARGHRPDVDSFLRLLSWLEIPAEEFLNGPVQRSSQEALAGISAALRSDSSLQASEIESLEQIVRVAYNHIRRRGPVD